MILGAADDNNDHIIKILGCEKSCFREVVSGA